MQTLFDNDRLSLERSIELSADSLRHYGSLYRHWAIAFSGGKDSSATVTLVADLIEKGGIPRPESVTVLYADTRQELPPLHNAAMALMENLRGRGFDTRVVLPQLDHRYFVYMLGRGGAAAVEHVSVVHSKAEGDEHGAGTGCLARRAGREVLDVNGGADWRECGP